MQRKHIAALCALLLAETALAHNVWIRPSSTQFSGEKDYITIDGAAADFPFDVNHRGRAADGLHAYDPAGKEIEKENIMAGKLRTSYDALLNQHGTYRFTDGLEYIQFYYPDEKGESVRWRGTPEKYRKENPMADKKREKYKQYSLNVETFATLGEPTDTVIKPDDKGLDVEYLTHPNELYAGESGKFRVLYDAGGCARSLCQRRPALPRTRLHRTQKRQRRQFHHRLAGTRHVLAVRGIRNHQRSRQRRTTDPRIHCRTRSPAALSASPQVSQTKTTRRGGFCLCAIPGLHSRRLR